MDPAKPRRRLIFILIGLAVVAAAIWAALTFGPREIGFTDDAVEVELIPPAAN